jgi:hypothetical protein
MEAQPRTAPAPASAAGQVLPRIVGNRDRSEEGEGQCESQTEPREALVKSSPQIRRDSNKRGRCTPAPP